MEIFRPELQSFPLRANLDEARDTIGEAALTEILEKYRVTYAELLDPRPGFHSSSPKLCCTTSTALRSLGSTSAPLRAA